MRDPTALANSSLQQQSNTSDGRATNMTAANSVPNLNHSVAPWRVQTEFASHMPLFQNRRRGRELVTQIGTIGPSPIVRRLPSLTGNVLWSRATSSASSSAARESNKRSSLFEEEYSWNLQLIGSKTPKALEVQKKIPSLQVDVVYAVRNPKIEERYMDEVAKTLENGTFRGFHSVWHGTSEDDAIVQSGFGVGGVDVVRKHGAAYGVGVYVTTKPMTAARYSRMGTDLTKFRLLLCELCETEETINNESSPHIYVSPNKRLIRPIYVVHVNAQASRD